MNSPNFLAVLEPSPLPHVFEGSRVRDYLELLKPRVMTLVVFSGLVGLFLAPGPIHPFLGFIVILCIALSAGGSAAVNMWFDRDIDAIMLRTLHRPIPEGRVLPVAAAEFGGILIFASVVLMGLSINALAAGLLAFAAFFYVYVYTMKLKRSTPQNIVIGGAAGAFPPMISWVAVTGHLAWTPLALFLIIFFWTPPHFWALALYRHEDYAKAGVPMMPVAKGEAHTKLLMVLYTIVLVPITLLPTFLGSLGWLYGASALLLGSFFVVCAVMVLRDRSYRWARRMFGYSIVYLTLLLIFMLVDHAMRSSL